MCELKDLVLKLYDIDAIKTGEFKLKTGILSPVYIDLRVVIAYPSLVVEISNLLWQEALKFPEKPHQVCGVPYTALPFATHISITNSIPMLIRRKESKDYGTKKMIEGKFEEGDTCLIIEDVVTTGSSVKDTAKLLNEYGLKVTNAVVLLNRGQGGDKALLDQGIHLKSVLTLPMVLDILQSEDKIESSMVEKIKTFLSENTVSRKDPPEVKITPCNDADTCEKTVTNGNHKKRSESISYGSRSKMCLHNVSSKLLSIMEEKQSNLCLSADVQSCSELLDLAESLGPLICCIKTHVDILDDFDKDFTKKLVSTARKHNFLIFEDRKFADIGNTVKMQYTGGLYQISGWADIINAHSVPGPGIIEGLKSASHPSQACLMLAQMSSSGNLADDKYTRDTVEMAKKYPDFVVGFISTRKVSDDPCHIHFTPGVKLETGIDALGQRYLTPDVVIREQKSDVIIVGRGIIKSDSPWDSALKFKNAGWDAYQKRLSSL